MSRGMSALLGAIVLAAGIAGLSTVSLATPAGAQVSQRDGHDLMHEMMDAMHGPEATEQMDQVPGAEEMMDQCAAVMAMMNSGMMGGMMGGE
ncbi:MAG: hypothetical protein M3N51_08335 [Actinomycetota bacterium]|nr:hypothetical protein [Actinomycetota bacterium]